MATHQIDKDSEILDAYKELDRILFFCIPKDNAALKVECGAWVVEIVPKDRKKHTFRRAFDEATSGQKLQSLLDKLLELDDMWEFNDSYYNYGWWTVAIRYKDNPGKKDQGPDYVAAYFASFYGMNDKWCDLIVRSTTTELTIRGAERGQRNKELIVHDPKGEMWDEAERLAHLGVGFQGEVIGDINRKVTYDLRKVETQIKQPSVTVRDKNVITHREGRAVQVTETPAMTVITLWKEIEYK